MKPRNNEGPADSDGDDVDRLLAEQMVDAGFRASYADITNRTETCINLLKFREASGVATEEVAAFLVKVIGMPTKRALRWVEEFETGQLFHNAPLWLVNAYARSVGLRVRMVVEAQPPYAQASTAPVAQQLLDDIAEEVRAIKDAEGVIAERLGRRDDLIRAALRTDLPRAAIAKAAGIKEARLYQIRDGRR